jgi:leucyl aminopeptidase (aminopeptidase T)
MLHRTAGQYFYGRPSVPRSERLIRAHGLFPLPALVSLVRVAPAVVLSPEELERLRSWRDAGTRSPERALRARIVLRAAEGAQDREIAKELSVHRRTVARWRRRFLAARLDGLSAAPRVVQRGGLTTERISAILRASTRSIAPGEPLPSTRALARQLGVGHATVHRLWATHGVRPFRRHETLTRADPAFPLVPWDVVGLYLDGRSAALAVTLHPAAPGEIVAAPPIRTDVLRREPALGAPTVAKESGTPREAGASGGVLPFVAGLAPQVPPSVPLHVLVWTDDPRWTVWAADARVRRPTLHTERVRDRTAWAERATALVSAAGRRPRSHDRVRGPAELSGALRRWLADYRPGAGPYLWRASSREVTRGEAAYRLRSELAGTGHPGFHPVGGDRGPESPARPSPAGPTASADERLRAMARSIVRQSLKVRRGEWVLIDTWSSTLAEANALALESLRVGGRPSVIYRDEATFWAASTEVPSRHLSYFGAHRKAALERSDVFITFFGPSDRERFHALPPRVIRGLREGQDDLYETTARAGARAVQLALGRVSPASARMYGVDPTAWRNELVEASLVEPRVLARRARLIIDRLSRPVTVRVAHPNGTDLTLRLLGRRPAVSDGRVPKARRGAAWTLVVLPAGVVVAPLAETVADGVFRSNQPSSVGLSTTVGEMSGGRWTFRDGRLTRYGFDVGEELFAQSYVRAPDGKDRPGALSIGLNERIDSAPLLEDQALGTVTLQIGRNDHLGGRNRARWWAWLYLRGADVTVDGEPLLRGGRIVP